MISLSWFLFAWLVLMAFYGLAVLLTIGTHLKFGVASFSTYATAAIFLLGIVIVFLIVGPYLASIDWSQTINAASAYAVPLH